MPYPRSIAMGPQRPQYGHPMSTPPRGRPRPDSATPYAPTLMDRLGPDGALEMRARVVSALAFALTGTLTMAASRYRPATAAHPIVTGFAGGLLGAGLMYFMMRQLPAAAGSAALAITAPSGRTTPYEEDFSAIEAIAARGEFQAALAAYEEVIAERPDAVLPRMRAAELCAGRLAAPARAAELFREIRGIAGATRREALYACSRLVDLYDGALDEPGRALVELRRIIELYPGTDAARHAHAALPRMKARLLDASSED